MIHACEFETSLMLASHPDLVDMTKAVREYPDPSPAYEYGAEQLGNISKSGVFGDATIATAEKGSAMLNRFVDDAVQIIQGARR
jgi:creatinine amidohydrolase